MNKDNISNIISNIDKYASLLLSKSEDIVLIPHQDLNPNQKKYLEYLTKLADNTAELSGLGITEPNFSNRRIAILQGNRVAGFLTPIQEHGFWNTDSIFVDPKLQGQGVGKKAIMSFFHHMNHKPGKVWIANFNKASQKAFQACGFAKEEMYNRSDNPNEQGYLYVLY